MDEIPLRFLFLPSVKPSQGWGHIARSQVQARTLGAKLWAPEGIPVGAAEGMWLMDVPDWQHWDVVVLDRMRTETDVFRLVRNTGKLLVGWDEGGRHRKDLDYLLDTLGNLSSYKPNLKAPELLPLGQPRGMHLRAIKKVLIAFGGDGTLQLGLKLLEVLTTRPDPGWEVTVLQGPWQNLKEGEEPALWGRPIIKLPRPESLGLHLPAFDLVFCSYGLTALECLRQGVPFILINPTRYHTRLTKKYAFPCAGTGGVNTSELTRILKKIENVLLRPGLYPVLPPPRDFKEFWGSLRSVSSRCPACGDIHRKIISRAEDRTYFSCETCGFLSMSPWKAARKNYSVEYFHEEYKRQYGRTYLQDFSHIAALGKGRLEYYEKLSGSKTRKVLLDIGCAYGPFLFAAQGKGYQGFGLDISEDAVGHVRDELAIPALAVNFHQFSWEMFSEPKKPDLVSLWYVIEHFENLVPVMEKLEGLVPSGGWLLLGTPNALGITGRFHKKRFLKKSPDDHFTLWTPASARRLLARYGFEVLSIRPTGIHPYRLFGFTLPKFLDRILSWVLKILGWGDTMEIYARKLR